jgi:two-component system CheB/CheR fusion protein
MNMKDLVPPVSRKNYLHILKKIGAGEDIKSFNTKRLTKSGQELDIWLTVTKLTDKDGNITSVATTERDITGMGKG